MAEYKNKSKEELENRRKKYPEIRVELVFGKICKQHALWDINESNVGVEAALAFRAASLRHFRAFPQSVKLLKELGGYPMVIVSNAQAVFFLLELKHLDLIKHFKFVVLSSEFGHRKPDPRIILERGQNSRPESRRDLVHNDNIEHDIAPSAKLGMKAMHIEEAWMLLR